MAITVRPITDHEVDEFLDAESRHFGLQVFEGQAEALRSLIGLDRTYAAVDEGGGIVGTAASFTLAMTVPGGATVPTAGLTAVTVASTHRRQGLLNRLIGAHFDDAAARGEPLSALWASETAIYGRYGYGMSVPSCGISFDSREAQLRPPDEPDVVSFARVDEAKAILPELHERLRVETPGQFHRSMPWWEHRRLADHEWMRKDSSPRRTIIAQRHGKPVGYATYRQKERWRDTGIPDGEVQVQEVQGIDVPAQQTLWWFLANIDLYPNVKIDFDRPDSIVPWLAENFRAVVHRVDDTLWLRVLDVEQALSSRRYDAAGRFVFEVLDDRLPTAAGTYVLDIADDGVGRCARSEGPAAFRLTAAGLATLYLGANKPLFLEAMGAIDGDREATERFGRSVAWPVTAWCNETF